MATSQTQQPTQTQPDAATLGALVVILMSGAPAAAMASLAVPLLAPLGIGAAEATEAIGLVWPLLEHDVATATSAPQSALSYTLRTQVAREAAYVVRAAQRLVATRDLAAERRYIGQHLAAERGRRDAARAVDSVAARHRGEVGWYSVRDDRTTDGCRGQHGQNFNAATPPFVEGRPAYPGAVHLHCRCRPGPPFPVGVRAPSQNVSQATQPASLVALAFDPNEPRDWHGRWMRVGAAIGALFTARSRFAADALPTTTEAIADVHAMPHSVPSLPVNPNTRGELSEKAAGGVGRTPEDPGTPLQIILAGGSGGHGPYTDEWTLTHEIGHVVDLTAFRDEHNPVDGTDINRFYASHDGPLAEVIQLAEETDALRQIRKLRSELNADDDRDLRLLLLTEYLLRPHEIFARAYAQWIALRSGNRKLQHALNITRSDGGPEQWSDRDFEQIARAMDRIFRERGWLR